MKEKLVIPASLKLKGLGITGEEVSWAQLCDSLDVNYKGQSAHRLVKTKYPEVHDAICKDCIYDKPKAAKPVKAKAGKEGKPVKAKPVKPVAKLVCAGCGCDLTVLALQLTSGNVSTGKFEPDGVITALICPYCAIAMAIA